MVRAPPAHLGEVHLPERITVEPGSVVFRVPARLVTAIEDIDSAHRARSAELRWSGRGRLTSAHAESARSSADVAGQPSFGLWAAETLTAAGETAAPPGDAASEGVSAGEEVPAAVGLRELLERAHEIEGLAVTVPPALAGLYRVLYALTARVTGLDRLRGWRNSVRRPPG